ncbi:MAG: tRNA modification GTPase [Planctomycetaceae bacterium]|nr:tRNA modification GTPase [Planctomycetaceae bacterium]
MLADLDPEDTIAAVASPPGPGVRGLVRISGRNAWRIALDGFRSERDSSPPRRPEVRRGALAVEGLRPLLPAIVALWPGPRTYTGQDVAEIHTVGALPLLTQVLAGCLNRGARHARSGEFTLRAFLSGRIDLTRAEAVLGVIDARNSTQLDAALRQLAGGLSRPIHDLRDRLLDLVAHLEANLDFADESDVDPLGRAALADELQSSAETLSALTDRLTRRDRPAGNPRVVVSGPPNAGKSRLFNALLGHDRAIVSPRAGTTRDYLTAACDVGGMIVELIDTAGLDLPRDPIETQAQTHRADQAGQADLLLVCTSPDTLTARGELPHLDTPALSVWTKCDLGRPDPSRAAAAILTSAATGEGLVELRAGIARLVRDSNAEADLPASTGARCRDSLVGAKVALGSASQTLRDGGGEELVALDLRLALDELGKVVGAVVTDDILDRIFQRFCIGK